MNESSSLMTHCMPGKKFNVLKETESWFCMDSSRADQLAALPESFKYM
jgi:hypothetical protein